MSDFLTTLVERTIMPELTVQPKLISPYEQTIATPFAFEQPFESQLARGPDPPSDIEPAAKPEEIPTKSQIDFEGVKPHPTIRNEVHEERVIEVSEEAPVQDQKTLVKHINVTKPQSLPPKDVLRVERHSIRTRRVTESFPYVIADQKGDSRATTASSVTIKIGRVEVRATMAPPSRIVERRTQSLPRSSLDDYLEKRSKGGRS